MKRKTLRKVRIKFIFRSVKLDILIGPEVMMLRKQLGM